MKRAASSLRQSHQSLSILLKRNRSSQSESSCKSGLFTVSPPSSPIDHTLGSKPHTSPLLTSSPSEPCVRRASCPSIPKPCGFWERIRRLLNSLSCRLFGGSICYYFCGRKQSYVRAYSTPNVVNLPTTLRRNSEDLRPANVPYWMTVSSEENMLKSTLMRTAQGAKAKTKKVVAVTRRFSMF